MSALSTSISRFGKVILRQYPLPEKELAALEKEKQVIPEALLAGTGKGHR